MTTSPQALTTRDADAAPRLLVVEDNPDILANLYAFLGPLGYVVDSARSGPGGLAMAARGGHDVIVLDLMLPGMDGIDVCRELRRTLPRPTPILMLTARDTVQDKVAGFGVGADDYLVKPFSLVELELRLRALHRRARNQHGPATLALADLRVDLGTYEARRAGTPLHLTPSGFKLLIALLRASPRVVPRSELEWALWEDSPPTSDALRTHMHALRLAVDRPFAAPLLRTLPGIGYSIADPHAQ